MTKLNSSSRSLSSNGSLEVCLYLSRYILCLSEFKDNCEPTIGVHKIKEIET